VQAQTICGAADTADAPAATLDNAANMFSLHVDHLDTEALLGGRRRGDGNCQPRVRRQDDRPLDDVAEFAEVSGQAYFWSRAMLSSEIASMCLA
jgi:hypothetical protein